MCSRAAAVDGSRTPSSVMHWPTSMIVTAIAANVVHAAAPPPSAVVTGMIATTVTNSPIVAKILVRALMRSRSEPSRVSEGSMDQ